MADLYTVIRGIVRGLIPETDYLALYPATVIKQDSDGTLQLKPDSNRVPPLAGVPIRSFAPQVAVEVEQGARVLLGFGGGDPTQPYAALWGSGTVTLVTIGAPGDAKLVALAEAVNANFQVIRDLFETWQPTPQDGGAALRTLAVGSPLGPPTNGDLQFDDVSATKLKTE